MHGEYKTPGGKLVRVDFSVTDDHIRDVVVSGDFFLYPEEALTNITSALIDAPTSASEAELTARIAAAVPAGTEWLGSSPAGLAIAVRRALNESDSTNA